MQTPEPTAAPGWPAGDGQQPSSDLQLLTHPARPAPFAQALLAIRQDRDLMRAQRNLAVWALVLTALALALALHLPGGA